MIEVTQYTIACYVDDNNLSHKNLSVIPDIINKVKKNWDLSVVGGNNHTF